jgi:hypothetical protein
VVEPTRLTDAESDAWDALHDNANIICTCDGCNYYSPTFDADKPCELGEHIKAILTARVRDAKATALRDAKALGEEWMWRAKVFADKAAEVHPVHRQHYADTSENYEYFASCLLAAVGASDEGNQT